MIKKHDNNQTALRALHRAPLAGRSDFSVLADACQFGTAWAGLRLIRHHSPCAVRPLARGPRVLIDLPLPLGYGLDGRLLLARRGRVCV